MGWLDSLISKTGINKQDNFRKQELEYLRNELNQRLSFSYEHSHKLFGHIMLVWGGTLALLGNTKENGVIDFGYVLFIMATIFFISVVVLYLLSQRNSENMSEISKLAAYITIFYEKNPHRGKQDGILWELATFEINKKEKGKSPWGRLKNEYFVLSCIATGIIVVVFVIINCRLLTIDCNALSISLMCEKNLCLWICTSVGCVGYIVISGILTHAIFKQLSLTWEDWGNKKKKYLKSFIEYAIEIGYYTDDDIMERFGEKFCKDIKYK
jgi:hypothetical protein